VSRSFLFVPGDSERKLAKAADCSADALIIDLEDSVDSSKRETARQQTSDYLKQSIGAELWVRINPKSSPESIADLQSIMPSAPHGIVLPKPEGAADVQSLSGDIEALERENGIEPGSTLILPIVTERPAALFALHEYAEQNERLAGLTWGAEDLSTALGAATNRNADGRWLAPYELARSLCLFASAAAKVPAIDTVYTDFRDEAGLARFVSDARRDGFSGMLAIHPDQVPVINAAFEPSKDEIARARKIVQLFADNSGSGVLQLDGEMIDRPHYIQAKQILDLASRFR
jgi:citrate lyase subunit beta/citryl-CoA lyase